MIKTEVKIDALPDHVFKTFCHLPGAILLDSQRVSFSDRYSFIAWEPQETIKGDVRSTRKEDLFSFIDLWPRDYFVAGYIGYEVCQWIETLPNPGPKDVFNPHFYLAAYPKILVFDNIRQTWYLWQREDMPNRFRLTLNRKIRSGEKGRLIGANQSKKYYIDRIKNVLDYIAAGEVYQINYTQRFYFTYSGDPFGLYLQLKKVQPVSFGAFLNLGDGYVVSGSPELFLRVKKGTVLTKPMKGTIKRSSKPTKDRRLRKRLKESIKDRAENVMIVDLMRNDLGRFCRFGSVEVPRLFVVEAYSTVYQMVSHVTGEVEKETTRSDIIRGVFPPGSITGAPKKRAMEIIYELEPNERGVYCGAIGYLWADQMVFNVAIRTVEIANGKGVLGVGGGIVADSRPELEYEESLLKARATFMALGIDL
nr:aminodeoxychorismate synthase component I [Desulfobacterales bacterium]